MKKPNRYLAKHQLYPAQISVPVPTDLQLIIVIPCHNEPDLIRTLEALWYCQRPPCAVEVIVVINAASEHVQEIHIRNVQTFDETRRWVSNHCDPCFAVYPLLFNTLPQRHAGAGLARKIGMDEAVYRFHRADNPRGIIISLDADCTCDHNYLTAIHDYFEGHQRAPGAAIYFEHPLSDAGRVVRLPAIARYELFLRYYRQAQHACGFPHAFLTVGSCMAVRCAAYERQGGMNRRHAGEDFYFLHKLIPLGHFGEIRHTTVRPSARVSLRTPFGTGQMMYKYMAGNQDGYMVGAPGIFDELGRFFKALDRFYQPADTEGALKELGETMRDFLQIHSFHKALAELRANTASLASFRKRFFGWFNALRLYQFVRYATDHGYSQWPVDRAAAELLRRAGLLNRAQNHTVDTLNLLIRFRQLDREGIRLTIKS